jgi:hypothetical protein
MKKFCSQNFKTLWNLPFGDFFLKRPIRIPLWNSSIAALISIDFCYLFSIYSYHLTFYFDLAVVVAKLCCHTNPAVLSPAPNVVNFSQLEFLYDTAESGFHFSFQDLLQRFSLLSKYLNSRFGQNWATINLFSTFEHVSLPFSTFKYLTLSVPVQ